MSDNKQTTETLKSKNRYGRLPSVIRPSGYTTGLTGECAYLWACFLMNEADMNDDYLAYDTWKACVETLQPKPGKAIPALVHYPKIEEAIEKYGLN